MPEGRERGEEGLDVSVKRHGVSCKNVEMEMEELLFAPEDGSTGFDGFVEIGDCEFCGLPFRSDIKHRLEHVDRTTHRRCVSRRRLVLIDPWS